LRWLNAGRKKGIVTVDTPNTSALIGFVRDNDESTKHLAAYVENGFCSLLLSSLDGKPIAQSEKMILVATAQCTNSGVEWQEDGQTLDQWGSGPTVVEIVRGSVSMRGLQDANSVNLQPLSPTGRVLNGSMPAQRVGDSWKVDLGSAAATWYLVQIQR
jgi:hypothetical protein